LKAWRGRTQWGLEPAEALQRSDAFTFFLRLGGCHCHRADGEQSSGFADIDCGTVERRIRDERFNTENTEKKEETEVLPHSLLGWREAFLHGLETLAHFLKEALEFFESFVQVESFSLLPVYSADSSPVSAELEALPGFPSSAFFQAGDLSFDHRHHFDAEVVAFSGELPG